MPKDIVLCVDDEPAVLRSCSVAMEAAGFRLMVDEDGIAGWRTFEENRDGIGLVLSDVVMPNRNGMETAEALGQIEPNAKLLLMSGYRDKIPDLQSRERFAFIRKPFIHAVLIDKVRSVLGITSAATS